MADLEDFLSEQKQKKKASSNASTNIFADKKQVRQALIITALGIISIMIAKYFYDLGRGSDFDNVPLITAESLDFKEKPEERGGMQIPHLDKNIYESWKPELVEKQDAVIRPMPEAEDPIQYDPLGDLLEEEVLNPSKNAKPHRKPVKTVQPKSVRVNNGQATNTQENIIIRNGKRINVDKLLAKKINNEIWIQLGTYPSEMAATKAWQDVSENNNDLLEGISLKVKRSEIAEKGTYYRLQSGPLNSEVEAKNVCRKLNERGQNCFFAKSTKNN